MGSARTKCDRVAEPSATLATLPERAVEDVLWGYRDRMLDLKNDKRFRYILIFKNHGEAAGATIDHPHSQLIALPIVPRRVEKKSTIAGTTTTRKNVVFSATSSGRSAIRRARDRGNEHFITLAPYAPRFPFEMWLLPKVHGSSYENNQSSIYASLARMLKDYADEARPGAGPARAQLHDSYLSNRRRDQRSLSLAYRDHSEIDESGRFRMGHGFYINPTPPEESARFCGKLSSPLSQKKSRFGSSSTAGSPKSSSKFAYT